MRPAILRSALVARIGSTGRRQCSSRYRFTEPSPAHGRIYAAVADAGRKARGRCAFDLLIAATALAAEFPLYTRTPSDFQELKGLLEVVPVQLP